MIDEQGLIRRATAAWLRSGGEPDGLTGHARTRADGKAHVAVCRGGRPVALYRLRNDGKLKRLRRWPAELKGSARDG